MIWGWRLAVWLYSVTALLAAGLILLARQDATEAGYRLYLASVAVVLGLEGLVGLGVLGYRKFFARPGEDVSRVRRKDVG